MDRWYYKLFGDEFGPVSMNELVELAKSQALSGDDEVRFGETGVWRRAGSMGQLMAHMPSGAHLPVVAQPVPTQKASEPVVPSNSNFGSVSSWTDSDTIASPKPATVGWYYKVFGDEFGPVSIDELIEIAKNHTLSSDDEVRFGEKGLWRRAGSIGQLMAHLPFAPPKPPVIAVSRPSISESQVAVSQVAPQTEETTEDSASGTSASSIESEAIWWCNIQGKDYGPVALEKLLTWAGTGRLLRSDLVRFGSEPYVPAGELPGLFPEIPATPEKRPGTSTPAIVTTPPKPASVVDSPKPEETAKPVEPAPAAMRPPMSSFSPPPSRGIPPKPVVPVRRPSSSSSSSDLIGKLVMPAIVLVVLGLVGVGGYFALPILMYDKAADVKKLKEMEAAFQEVAKVRKQDGVKPDDFKPAMDKLNSVAKPIQAELKKIKTKSPAQAKLYAVATSLLSIAKADDLVKPHSTEKSVEKNLTELKKILGL